MSTLGTSFLQFYLRPALQCDSSKALGFKNLEARNSGTEMELEREFVSTEMTSSPRVILFIIPRLASQLCGCSS